MIARQMKFIIESSVRAGSARLGQLDLPHPSSSNGEEVLTYPTPMYFVHTQAGSVPHLTSEVFHMVYQDIDGTAPIPPLQISIESTYTFHDAVGPSGMSCAKFVGLKNCPTLLTLLSPLSSFTPGYNDKLTISIWPRVGRRKVTVKSVNQITSDYKPTIVQCISDYDVCSDTSDKRLKKGTQRTLEYLLETINHFKLNKSTTDHLNLLATIEPLWFQLNEEEANKTLALILEQQNHFSGFLMRKNCNEKDSGSSSQTTEDEETTEKKLNDIQQEQDFVTLTELFMNKLPEDKLRFVSGSCSLDEIFSLVLQGVDAFDTSFCTKLTDEATALVLPTVFYEGDLIKMKSSIINETLPVHEKSTTTTTNHNNNSEKNDEISSEDSIRSNLQVLNLKDKRYFEDFQPLSLDCNCYTCRKYTRSYIHHLYATTELLGPVLLMKHNLTTFDRFFKVLRSYLMSEDSEKIEKLRMSLVPVSLQVLEPTEEELKVELRK